MNNVYDTDEVLNLKKKYVDIVEKLDIECKKQYGVEFSEGDFADFFVIFSNNCVNKYGERMVSLLKIYEDVLMLANILQYKYPNIFSEIIFSTRLVKDFEYPGDKMCAKLFETSKDLKTTEVLKQILYTGRYGTFKLNSNIMQGNVRRSEIARRLSWAELFINQPNTFNYFVSNNINIFHGTNSDALFKILTYGLKSHESSLQAGTDVTTGEKSSRRPNYTRDFISFTDVFNIASYYTGDLRDSSFPVVICSSVQNLEHYEKVRASTECIECAILDDVKVSDIKAIGVPEDKILYVKTLIGDESIEVVPIDIKRSFFQIDIDGTVSMVNNITNERVPKSKKISLENLKQFFCGLRR